MLACTLLSSYPCFASFMSQPRVDPPAATDGAVCLGCPLQDVHPSPPQLKTYTRLIDFREGRPSFFSVSHTPRQLANSQCPQCTHTYTRLALCAVNANSIWDAGVWLTADLQSVLPYAPHTQSCFHHFREPHIDFHSFPGDLPQPQPYPLLV